MKKKKKLILGIAGAVSIVIVASAVIIAFLLSPANVYARKINEAEKYAEAGDYENAVLAYQEAIEQDPENVEAYLGLAVLYDSNGQTDLAMNLLISGFEKTGSSRLKLMLNNLMEKSGTGDEEKGETQAKIDEEIFSVFSAYSFADYTNHYGISSKNGNRDGSVTVRVTGVNADFTYRNTDNQPSVVSATVVDNTAVPAAISMDNILSLFGVTESITYEELQSMNLNQLTRKDDAEHGTVISFVYEGAQVTAACSGDGTVSEGAWNEIIPVVHSVSFAEVTISGLIIDAQTGSSIPDASIVVREGTAESGTSVRETTSGASGVYSVTVPSGEYTFEIAAEGYETVFREVYVGTYSKSVSQDFTITKSVGEGEVRIVLEWGATPRDLDSYLIGNTDSGDEVFVSYRSKVSESSGKTVAELDLDDIDGYGPETITLYDMNGTYTYSVVDFNMTGMINTSGATVTVYMPGEAPQTISISPDFSGEVWRVCEIDHGQLIIHNDAYGTTSPVSGK